jgi:hypothetical protein
MPEEDRKPATDVRDGFDHGYDGHRDRQARIGLSMTPAERLRWLEETMEEMRRLLGRARLGRPVDPTR